VVIGVCRVDGSGVQILEVDGDLGLLEFGYMYDLGRGVLMFKVLGLEVGGAGNVNKAVVW